MRRISIGLALLAALAALLLAPIGLGSNEFARTLEDAAHGPLFAIVAVVLLRVFRGARPVGHWRYYLIAFVAAVGLGAAAEVAQWLVGGRHAQWRDLWNDVLGAVAGLLLHLAYEAQSNRRRAMLGALLCAGFVVAPVIQSAAYYGVRRTQLPQLLTWELAAGHHFAIGNGARIMPAILPAQWGQSNLEAALHVTPLPGDRWAGVLMEEPWPDWRGYRHLEIDIVNPNEQPLELILRIDDAHDNSEHGDRFYRTLRIDPLKRSSVKVAMDDVSTAPASRRLDIGQVSKVVLFQDTIQGANSFYLASIRLAP